MTIRQRRRARTGDYVFDVHQSIWTGDGRYRSVHLGTFATRQEAEQLQGEWNRAGERDEQILRERRQRDCPAADGEYRWETTRRSYGTMGRTRGSHHGDPWVAFLDPTGNAAAARVDAEREARGRFDPVELEPAAAPRPDPEPDDDWWVRYWPAHSFPSVGWRPSAGTDLEEAS